MPKKKFRGSYDRTNDLTINGQDRVRGWEVVQCINCRGTGTRRGDICPLCKGARRIRVHR